MSLPFLLNKTARGSHCKEVLSFESFDFLVASPFLIISKWSEIYAVHFARSPTSIDVNWRNCKVHKTISGGSWRCPQIISFNQAMTKNKGREKIGDDISWWMTGQNIVGKVSEVVGQKISPLLFTAIGINSQNVMLSIEHRKSALQILGPKKVYILREIYF